MDFPTFARRSRQRESMDSADAARDLIHAEYRFLERLNRVGRTAEHVLSEVDRRCPARARGDLNVVDFGSGGGAVAARLHDVGARAGRQVRVTASDRSAVAVEYAQSRSNGRYASVQADMLHSPFTRGAFDVASCSLVLHHLSDEDVVRALQGMAAAAGELVVWIDLLRDGAGMAGAWLSTIGSRKELRHDAVASVRRGFTRNEAHAAAEAAGLREIVSRRISLGRFVLSARPGSVPARRPTVRATQLSVSFGPVHVLREQSLVAHAGEIVAVRGPNGVGKSTLLGCIAGARRPDGGACWADHTLGRIGFHPQEGGLFTELDAQRNIATFARLGGVGRRDLDRVVREAIARWGLSECAARPVTALSGGLRRRVALAACFAHAPRLAVLDEPEAGLDARGRELLSGQIRDIAHGGGTAVLSCHDPFAIAGGVCTVIDLGGSR